MFVDNKIIYTDLGNDEEVKDLRDDMRYLAARKPRKYARNDFVDTYFDELSSTFTALQDYLSTFSMPLLQELDFNTFCNFCFLYSYRTR